MAVVYSNDCLSYLSYYILHRMDREDKYTITDLYLAAYLKAVWFRCEIESKGKRCFFIFDLEAKEEVARIIWDTEKEAHNVNATVLINEIKQLKSYVINV